MRRAARVVLLDPDDRVLLLQFRDPLTNAQVWVTPGGGLEPGETHEAAALRELAEETGLRLTSLGPSLGEVAHGFRWNGQRYEQTDRFFAARTAAAPSLSAPGLDRAELLVTTAWWTVDELASLGDALRPPDLAERARTAARAV